MEKKYSLFHVEGGLGKHVASIAITKTIKNNYPDRELIVVCAYPEIFINLPFIDRVYRLGNTPYFYQDYILDKDTLIFKQEPYFTTSHIHKELPLIESWSNVLNLEYNGEKSELIFNFRQRQRGFQLWNRERPIMVIQTNGGPLENQPYLYSWTRDIPYHTTQELVNYFSKDYHIIQVARHKSNILANVEGVYEPLSNMELFSLLLYSEKQILIDSSLQHAAAALNKKSTVLWVATSPDIFGYDLHDNIVADIPRNFKLPDSYLFDYNFNGALHECPLITDNIFDVNEIINSVEST